MSQSQTITSIQLSYRGQGNVSSVLPNHNKIIKLRHRKIKWSVISHP